MKKVVLILVVAFALQVNGQKLDIGLQLGGSFYGGDMSQPNIFQDGLNMKLAIGGLARFEISEGLILRAGVIFTKVSADDSESNKDWQIERNLNFRSNILEFNLLLELHPFSWFRQTKHFDISPYAFIGMATFHFNPQTYYQDEWIDLQPLGTEGQGLPGYESPYNLQSFAIPFGIGVRYQISNNMFIDFEYGARRTGTDYLDDISNNYVSVTELSEADRDLAAAVGNKINAPSGKSRGNISVKDWYSVSVVTIAYQFELGGMGYSNRKRKGKAMGCPKF